MNKTVSINLGGLFFHIDEDAYQKLNRYFDAIKRSLSPDGKDEIMNDIEGRIAELLLEKLKNDKQVVGLREIDEVIAVMGQPEDYRIDEEAAAAGSFNTGYITVKKFYRDGDRGMIAGVCAGIAHYFRIDPLWIRIIFILSLLLSFGTSVFVYILLWILIPKAITTTEKLEMTGEPINISNIEKKVREEISGISEKLNNVDYNKLGTTARNGAEKIGNTIGDVFSFIFKAIAKVVGAFIVILSAITLGSMVIGLFVLLFSSTMTEATWYPYMNIFNYTDTPLWIVGIAGFCAIAIPIFFLFMLGLKILVNNLRPIGSITGYTFLGIWILSVASLIYIGMRQASEVSSESKTIRKEVINLAQNDTLYINFRNNDYFSKDVDRKTEVRFTQDSTGNHILYSNSVSFYVMKTDGTSPYIQVEKLALGSTMDEARQRAEKINYGFKIEGNRLILDNYLLSDIKNKYRNQRVEIYLYLPNGTYFKPDSSVQLYDETDNSFFDLWFNSDKYTYRMEDTGVKCLNCSLEDPENKREGSGPGGETINVTGSRTENVDIKISKDSLKIKATSAN
ncbi:hypothetical protein CHU92_06500 [Flavobacterium cyanobacteriorum]|uniref:Uncharacterized protein n=1 Tax=Flavobacterium cyanobacteriorum TaxID=2022802 RepID=A0A255Z970_9FLAO|nr:PspC domain-containing protein [Flavobacterium cyanobacteriorum]OYQ38113.1 hypothetical protein CHU92_06500 [Flavobacterium cyanobacteriorum]